MAKIMILPVIALFLGCATPRGRLTTPLDYLPLPDSALTKSEDSEAIAEHNISVSPVWSFVLTGNRTKDIYSGLSLTGTTKNNLLSFKLMFTVSRDYIESTTTDVSKMPELLGIFVPIKTIATIRAVNRAKDYVVMPAITIPLAHYKLKFGFGTEPNVVSSVELRTGMAYDIYFRYTHGDYYVSLFDGEEKKIAIPNNIADNGYISHITSINLDIAPLHLEANLILNDKECKTTLGIGAIW